MSNYIFGANCNVTELNNESYLSAEKDDDFYIINFKTEPTENLSVKISQDNSQILFTNRGETFLIKI